MQIADQGNSALCSGKPYVEEPQANVPKSSICYSIAASTTNSNIHRYSQQRRQTVNCISLPQVAAALMRRALNTSCRQCLKALVCRLDMTCLIPRTDVGLQANSSSYAALQFNYSTQKLAMAV
jgi:hypothetical protein